MIHNGIEYAEMQLLCDVYGIMKAMGKNNDEIADVLSSWKSEAGSYLLEITIDILRKREGDKWLLDLIMDKAGNKGTGNWAAISSAKIKLDLLQTDLLKAYQFARIVNHYQGFKVIAEASESYDWNLDLSEIARIWTNGCIIRSGLMLELIPILKETNDLLSHPEIIKKTTDCKTAISQVVAQSILKGISIPCMTEAITFFNTITTANSTANLIQAQRDYFGAHTYQRKDDDTGKYHHTQWI